MSLVFSVALLPHTVSLWIAGEVPWPRSTLHLSGTAYAFLGPMELLKSPAISMPSRSEDLEIFPISQVPVDAHQGRPPVAVDTRDFRQVFLSRCYARLAPLEGLLRLVTPRHAKVRRAMTELDHSVEVVRVLLHQMASDNYRNFESVMPALEEQIARLESTWTTFRREVQLATRAFRKGPWSGLVANDDDVDDHGPSLDDVDVLTTARPREEQRGLAGDEKLRDGAQWVRSIYDETALGLHEAPGLLFERYEQN